MSDTFRRIGRQFWVLLRRAARLIIWFPSKELDELDSKAGRFDTYF